MAKLRSLMVAILGLLFVAGIFFSTRSDVAAISSSTVTGLATMRHLATESTPYSVALSNSKPTLVEFYADWCTTCQSMAPILQNLHQQYESDIDLVMLNIDDPQWAKQIEQYQVQGIPHFTFLNQQQQSVKTLVGRVPETILSQILAQLASSY